MTTVDTVNVPDVSNSILHVPNRQSACSARNTFIRTIPEVISDGATRLRKRSAENTRISVSELWHIGKLTWRRISSSIPGLRFIFASTSAVCSILTSGGGSTNGWRNGKEPVQRSESGNTVSETPITLYRESGSGIRRKCSVFLQTTVSGRFSGKAPSPLPMARNVTFI